MSEQYQGTCPICGLTLIVIPGNKLKCSDEHYICYRWEFEKRWEKYQKLIASGEFSSFDELLVDLVKLNELNVDPVLVVQLQEKAITDGNQEP